MLKRRPDVSLTLLAAHKPKDGGKKDILSPLRSTRIMLSERNPRIIGDKQVADASVDNRDMQQTKQVFRIQQMPNPTSGKYQVDAVGGASLL